MANARLVFLTMLAIVGATGSGDFSWRNCRTGDSSSAHLHIDEFSFSPDPIRADDYVYMSMKSEVTGNATLPLTLTVTVKKITYFGWEMSIPCLSSTSGLPFGSCTYDVCSAMDHLKSSYGCPRDFTAAGLPCRCHFTPGSYDTTTTGPVRLYLDTVGLPFGRVMSSFLGGKYRAVVRVVDGDNNEAMCMEMRFALVN